MRWKSREIILWIINETKSWKNLFFKCVFHSWMNKLRCRRAARRGFVRLKLRRTFWNDSRWFPSLWCRKQRVKKVHRIQSSQMYIFKYVVFRRVKYVLWWTETWCVCRVSLQQLVSLGALHSRLLMGHTGGVSSNDDTTIHWSRYQNKDSKPICMSG